MASVRERQRVRAVQVGFVMRSYRESFQREDGRRGLTQEELLTRMGAADEVYAQRYSHATVSRWETGHTRPTVGRIKAFGTAVNLSETEVAGLILLAGLATDFDTAASQVDVPGAEQGKVRQDWREPELGSGNVDQARTGPSLLRGMGMFLLWRFLPLSIWIVALGYALSFANWDGVLMPVVYVGLTVGAVLAQGFVFPSKDIPLRELLWISVFLILSTPLLQFAPIAMDHYNFYAIGDFAGTPVPYVLALMLNLVLSTVAGLMFHSFWVQQYRQVGEKRHAFRRAALVGVAPVVVVFGIVVVITNLAVTIQLVFLFATLAAVFTAFLLLRDPSLNPGERDQRVLFPTVVATGLVTGLAGLFTILFVYASPELPRILPDHNLVASWEINFDELGYSREEALQKVNVGYLRHAMCLYVYMLFIIGGRLLVAVYRIGGGNGEEVASPSQVQAAVPGEGEAPRSRRPTLSLSPAWSFSRVLFSGKG